MGKSESKRSWLALAVVLASPFMTAYDSTSVYLALPQIAKDLSISEAAVQSVMTAYLVAVVATILLFGRLGDMLGKGRIFLLGLAVFGAGTLLAAFARLPGLLLFARVLEGFGAAALMANNQGIITEVFSEKLRGTALGISALFAAIGTALGPVVSGFILNYGRWNYIFLLNLPLALLAFAAGLKLLPKAEKPGRQALDLAGFALLALAVLLLFITLAKGDANGYGSLFTPLGFGGSVLLLGLFFLRERRAKNPFMALSLFRNPQFSLSILCVLLVFTVRAGAALLSPLFTEHFLKMDDETSGLVLLALPLAMGVLALFSGVLSNRFGKAQLTVAGLLAMLCACFGFVAAAQSRLLPVLVGSLCLMGLGSGLFSAPNTGLIMSQAPKGKLGAAGSINGFMRNLGSAVGVSFFSGVLYSVMGAKARHRVTGYVQGGPEAFQLAFQVVFWLAAGLLAVGLVLAIIRLRGQKQKNAPAKESG